MSKEVNNDMEIINKISAKNLGFPKEDIRDLVKKKNAILFRVYGQITNVEHGDGDHGPWTRFVGMFEAINLIDGNIVRSSKLFLPASVTGMVEGDVLDAKAKEGFAGFQMAYEIGAKKSDMAIGYEYTIKNLISPSEEKDILLQLRNSLEATKVLPAPKKKK